MQQRNLRPCFDICVVVIRFVFGIHLILNNTSISQLMKSNLFFDVSTLLRQIAFESLNAALSLGNVHATMAPVRLIYGLRKAM